MKTNLVKPTAWAAPALTFEGGKADKGLTPMKRLEREVFNCLLWEDSFYASGDSIAKSIADLCDHVSVKEICDLAYRARHEYKLRHAPLWLLLQAVRINSANIKATGRRRGAGPQSYYIKEGIERTIRRPDEVTEMLALYWKDGRKPIANAMKQGLAGALQKFDAYQLGKWNRKGAVTLKDALHMTHANVDATPEQRVLFQAVRDGTIETPDTWEVELSASKDKKASWTRLLTEKRMGYMARLMNLRNMVNAGVDAKLVESEILRGAERSWALPFRFVSAVKHAPQYADTLSQALVASVNNPEVPHLVGSTYVVVDVSGSMSGPLSGRSTLTRKEAAGALASLVREVSGTCRVFTFANEVKEIPSHRGLGLVAEVMRAPSGGTYLAGALRQIQVNTPSPDRLIVITDEQSHDGIAPCFATKAGYVLNVASYSPGIKTDQGWKRISGFSERSVEWIVANEGEGQ